MTSRECFEFISDALSPVSGLTFFPMMGEYIIKYNGKTVGGIYDDRLLIKITASSSAFSGNAERALPYPGAKEMFWLKRLPDPVLLNNLFEKMFEELPAAKQKHK